MKIFIMAVFTSSLPDDLLKQLTEQANALSIPKNRLIEKALRIYLDQLNKAAYAKSYRELGEDEDITRIAEEGMEDYYKQIVDK